MVISDSRKKAHNILAAAGRRGIVKLIHVAADFCYGEIKAHKKPIATVCFSPTQETHLFSKSASESLGLVCCGKVRASLTRGIVTGAGTQEQKAGIGIRERTLLLSCGTNLQQEQLVSARAWLFS